MREILIAGNPNVGKSTLFNTLTKSNEHTGNFHGVTVEEKSKVIKFNNEEFKFVDLPGLYSLNTFTQEEEISKNNLIKPNAEIIMLIDANTIKKNLYLCQQLNELDINYKILINNYNFFKKQNNVINVNILKNRLNKEIFIINAKKYKLNNQLLINDNKTSENNYEYLEKYIKIVQEKYGLNKKTIIFALNGIFFNLNNEQIEFIKSLYPELIKERYDFIENIIKDCYKVNKNFVYGLSKADKFFLNPVVSILGFALLFLLSFYSIFFLIGPLISDLEHKILDTIIINPFMNFLYLTTDNVWLIEFFRCGIFNSIITVITFVPQVTLLFIFLTILEDSGIISRFAYVFDDFLNLFGLNGKVIYIMLLGLGCNTMSTTATRNINGKNLKVKSAILNPYISCMARLPVYVLIASAFFGKFSFLVVAGLYLLGLVVALIFAVVLNKTILKTKSSELLLEFPALKFIDVKHTFQEAKKNSVDFFKRVFTTILCVGVIVWILTHTQFNLKYTDEISQSILFFFAGKLSFVFAPIGLNSAGMVCALVVGLLAKELIVSTISICNNASSSAMLTSSLLLTTSVINFSLPSAVSFLIFTLLYPACASNLAVIKNETSKFYMWFSVVSQLTIAYMLSFVTYQALTKGIFFALLTLLVVIFIMFAIVFTIKKVKHGKCLTCGKCKY